MAAQSVQAANMKSIDSLYTSKKNSSKVDRKDLDFAGIMNGNIAERGDTQKNREAVAEIKDTNQNKSYEYNQKKAEYHSKHEDNKTANVRESAETVNKEKSAIQEQISVLEKKIKEIMKDTLNISDEELEKIMSILGIQLIDLMDFNQLQAFVMEMHGENDISSLLTNEDLAGDLAKLLTAIQQMDTQELGILPENLDEIMNQIREEDESAIDLNSKTDELADTESEIITLEEDGDNKEITSAYVDNEEGEPNPLGPIKVQVDRNGSSAESETSTKQGNAGSQNTLSSEQSLAEGIVGRFADNMVQSMDDMIQQTQQTVSAKDIISQITEQIKITIRPNLTSMEIQLNPENLGKVNLQVMAKDGILTASFTAQNQMAKEAIESQIHVLKETLAQQNIKVEAIEVTVSNFAFSQSNEAEGNSQKQQKESSKKAFRLDEAELEDGSSIDGMSAVQSVTGNGLSVDYSA